MSSIVQQDERSAVDSLFGNGLSALPRPGVQLDIRARLFLVVKAEA